MAFKGRDTVRTKIVIDNKIIEQVNMFNYLGDIIFYKKKLDIDNKLHYYLKIIGILNNVFKHPKLLKNKIKIIQYTSPPSLVTRKRILDH